MTTELERTALADDNLALREIRAEELLHHDERLGRGDDLRLRVCLHKDGDIGGMVRLHVLHNEVIRATAVKLRFEVLQPFHAEVGVYRIHDGNFFIEDDIGIIGHAVFYGVLSLKKVYVMVVYADIANIFCYKHVKALPYVLNVLISVYHRFRTMQMLFKDSEMPGADRFGVKLRDLCRKLVRKNTARVIRKNGAPDWERRLYAVYKTD